MRKRSRILESGFSHNSRKKIANLLEKQKNWPQNADSFDEKCSLRSSRIDNLSSSFSHQKGQSSFSKHDNSLGYKDL